MDSRNLNIKTTSAGGTVVGLFDNQPDAERAIERLKQAGFPKSRIGVALKDRGLQEELIEDTGTQAADGAATGVVSGGVMGGVIGLLAGVGALAIPGVGPIIAGGALASTLTGAGIGAAAGGLIGALAGMGIAEEDARHFDRGFRAGGTLVTVSAADRAHEARQSLYESGADLGSMARGITGSVETSSVRMSTGSWPADHALNRTSVEEAQSLGLGDEATRGVESPDTEAWRGNERRYRHSSTYTGPERRVAEV